MQGMCLKYHNYLILLKEQVRSLYREWHRCPVTAFFLLHIALVEVVYFVVASKVKIWIGNMGVRI
jgi:hypothetical protein